MGIVLRWAIRATECGHVIDRKSPGGTYAEIARVPPGVSSYTDPDGTLHHTYRVAAFLPLQEGLSLLSDFDEHE